MSTADLAIVGMAVVSLASIGRDYRIQMKVADRLRLVNPPKGQPAVEQPQADDTTNLPTILGGTVKGGQAA